MKILQKTLQLHIPLADHLLDDIGKRINKKGLKAKTRIISPNQYQNSLLFLNHGITRNFYKSETKEWTSHFCQAGEFVVSLDSFFFNLPSSEFIETCTEVELIEIPKIEYQKLLAENPELYIVTSNIANENLKISFDRMHSWQLKTPAERYEMFVKQYPGLCKHVQLQHIASYLGITPYNLSRIRTQYKKAYGA